MESHYRYEEEIYTKEEEGISAVEERKRRGMRIHTGTIEEKVHLTFKVTLNGIGILCKKEG